MIEIQNIVPVHSACTILTLTSGNRKSNLNKRWRNRKYTQTEEATKAMNNPDTIHGNIGYARDKTKTKQNDKTIKNKYKKTHKKTQHNMCSTSLCLNKHN